MERAERISPSFSGVKCLEVSRSYHTLARTLSAPASISSGNLRAAAPILMLLYFSTCCDQTPAGSEFGTLFVVVVAGGGAAGAAAAGGPLAVVMS